MGLPKLIVDESLCCGCLSCMINCSQFHEQVASLIDARIRVLLKPFEGVHHIEYCRQCEQAECEIHCPQEAIKLDQSGPYYTVDYDLCIDCRTCVEVCPYGAMVVSQSRDCVIKCDLCGGSDPMCARSCFTGALWFGTEEDHPDRLVSRYFHLERK